MKINLTRRGREKNRRKGVKMRLENIRNKHTHHAFNGISRAYLLQYSKGVAVLNEL